MNKEFHELVLGDVIWATESDIGKHIYIICGSVIGESIDCIPAVTISSTCNECKDCCVQLNSVPPDWFKSNSKDSFIRLEEPRCINASNYQKTHYSFKGNITYYEQFYNEVCQKCHYTTQNICGCE